MSKSVLLEQALVLPAIDIAAMLRGQLIVAIPRVQIAKGLSFLLCPEQSVSQNEIVKQYRSPFLPLAEVVIGQNQDEKIQLEAWATCEQTQMIHDVGQLSTLSSLTVWNRSHLEELLKERQYLFLSYLNVYRLSNWITLPAEKVPSGKLGKFIGLSDEEPKLNFEPVKIIDVLPILSDRLFAQRKEQLENLKPLNHPELEELQSTIAHYTKDHPEAQDFSDDLQEFLGWTEPKGAMNHFPTWISEITTSGNSSDGYLFEKRVRQAFIQLGFTNTLNNALDPEAMGGAGGIDIYCEKPFAIVGECKASGLGNVGNGVCAQLINLGNANLGRSRFESAVKIIFAAGRLNTTHAEPAAKENKMNVMRPETLQRLVELKIAHPGSIDLLELKPCLETSPFGTDADDKVNKFIDKAQQQLKIRSYIARSVKALKDDGDDYVTASTVRTYFNATFGPTLGRLEKPENAYSLLIELASPLAGYLGRTQYEGRDWKADRFYFLRDLTV